MKIKITVYTLASDDDWGTTAKVFATEAQAVDALLEAIGWNHDDFTREQMKRFYFHPAELPDDYEDWYELISENKSDFDTYNIDEHTLLVDFDVNQLVDLDELRARQREAAKHGRRIKAELELNAQGKSLFDGGSE